jgi:hypothetical protein
MFGIIRPCRHRLGDELAAAWTAQLCGLCLALRDDHGQAARIATSYDGLVISLLVEAQSAAQPQRRTAGRCPLRGMRRADVAVGECVQLAAVVSLALAAARVRDHVADRDGMVGAVGVRPAARRIAQRWVRQSAQAGQTLGFDTGVLVAAIDRQTALEAAAGPGTSLLAVTEPTETAVAAAFAHTALLAGRPANQEPLREIGRLFGRLAHLLDAVEDYRDDVARGKWNPLAATATSAESVHQLCDDAVWGIELALADVEFTDDRLVQRLLTGELRRAVVRRFGKSGEPTCGRRTADVRLAYGDPPPPGEWPGQWPPGQMPPPGQWPPGQMPPPGQWPPGQMPPPGHHNQRAGMTPFTGEGESPVSAAKRRGGGCREGCCEGCCEGCGEGCCNCACDC